MTITVHGAKVYYEQHGEGKPLLMLHGWGCDVHIWDSAVRDLSATRRITVIDFPGHGQSSEPPAAWSVGEYAAMTAELIERLGLSGADIIAHSFGGRVGILLAATRPELVGKLLFTGCAGFVAEPQRRLSARTRLYKALRFLADNVLTRGVLGEAKVEKMRHALRMKFGSADYRALKTDVMRATFNQVISQDLREYLPRIMAPTLLYFGELDTATPLWMGEMMQKQIPDAGLVVAKGGTHYAFLEHYGEFLAITKHFFHIAI